jgi:hypothetical protein
MGKKSLDFDAVACIVDKHTGRVQAQFSGPFAEEEARGMMKDCAAIKEYQAGQIVTGEEAKRVMRTGRG